MARVKQRIPLQRAPSELASELHQSPETTNGHAKDGGITRSGRAIKPVAGASEATGVAGAAAAALDPEPAGLPQLLICVGGIYISFLTWALLQERITTTTYGVTQERFTYAIVLNTIQSTFAALTGYIYLGLSTRTSTITAGSGSTIAVFPSAAIVAPLLLVAVTSSLASPFGYAALGHIDYITFILAKSCKLLPVMFLHLTVFRKRYPLHKYAVVALVTAGVAVFTLYHPGAASHKKAAASTGNSGWGLFLLGVNLLFDGLTNSTQDQIFASFRPYSGPQMMVAQNVLSTLLTSTYLILLPFLVTTTPLVNLLSLSPAAASELSSALSFLHRHPAVMTDVLAFAACGAVGQIFIYHTLSRFSSLLLVTVTVTRKMLTMILSVLWFGHRLSGMQWLGVGLVFGGVGAEGWIARREKLRKKKDKEEGKMQ